eukprot:351382-Chlamydomonas_euryale.AAC.5
MLRSTQTRFVRPLPATLTVALTSMARPLMYECKHSYGLKHSCANQLSHRRHNRAHGQHSPSSFVRPTQAWPSEGEAVTSQHQPQPSEQRMIDERD